MGLDMFLKKTKKTNHTVEQLEELNNIYPLSPDNPSVKEFLPLREYEYLKDSYSIFHEVGYWRKFNALHNYFVTNIQGGVDECQTSEVTKKDLEKLLDVLKSVLENKDSSLLEPVGGFFFGSTDVDDYYFECVNASIDTISNVIENTDWDNERVFYRASW
jgi:hypothetical protein